MLERHGVDGSDTAVILHPPDDPVDYVRLDERHANLAPTPWVSTPTLYQNGFETCFLLTAWLACHLDNAIAQTKLEAPDRQPEESRETEDGVEVTTGALLGLMIDEGFIGIPDERRDEVDPQMRDEVVPVVIRFDGDMKLTASRSAARSTTARPSRWSCRSATRCSARRRRTTSPTSRRRAS